LEISLLIYKKQNQLSKEVGTSKIVAEAATAAQTAAARAYLKTAWPAAVGTN
jgi:hypothetical protein